MKLNKFKYILPAALLALSACTDDEELLQNISGSGSGQIQFTAVNGTPASLSKTTLSNGWSMLAYGSSSEVNFLQTDQIAVFSTDSVASKFGASLVDGSKAIFEGQAPEAKEYFALYPYQSTAKIDGNVISATIPTEQNFVGDNMDGNAALSVAYTTGDAKKFAFQNATTMISFVARDSYFSNITIEATDGTPIAGDIDIEVSKDSLAPVIKGGTSNKITLSGTANSGWAYAAMLKPCTVKAGALKFTFTTTDGKTYSEVNDHDVTLERGVCYRYGNISYFEPETLTFGDWWTNWSSTYPLYQYQRMTIKINDFKSSREFLWNNWALVASTSGWSVINDNNYAEHFVVRADGGNWRGSTNNGQISVTTDDKMGIAAEEFKDFMLDGTEWTITIDYYGNNYLYIRSVATNPEGKTYTWSAIGHAEGTINFFLTGERSSYTIASVKKEQISSPWLYDMKVELTKDTYEYYPTQTEILSSDINIASYIQSVSARMWTESNEINVPVWYYDSEISIPATLGEDIVVTLKYKEYDGHELSTTFNIKTQPAAIITDGPFVGCQIVGDGEFVYDDKFGIVYKNNTDGSAIRSNYLLLPTSTWNGDCANTGTLTVSFWIKNYNGILINEWSPIFMMKNGDVDSDWQYYTFRHKGQLLVNYAGWVDSPMPDSWAEYNDWLNGNDKWHYVVTTVSRNELTLYVDGEVLSTCSPNGTDGNTTDGFIDNLTNINFFAIGGAQTNGWMDPDIPCMYTAPVVSCYPITAEEVREAYNAAK